MTCYYDDNNKIEHWGDVVFETDSKTGITKVHKGGAIVATWGNISQMEMHKRQRHLIETGKIITDFKPEL